VEDIQTLALRKSDLLVNACLGESSSHNCVIFPAINYGKFVKKWVWDETPKGKEIICLQMLL
jgi:hypothetical protein